MTLLVHGDTLHYGFNYDDYYFMRPHSREQVVASFHGPWDDTGVMVKFYRPLTVAFSAARFELLGFNAVAHHTVSLALFGCAALLVAWLVERCTARAIAAMVATAVFIAHPAMPYSLVAWITNQMHLLQILVVLLAVVWWDAVRVRGLGWWLPLFVFAAASLMIKEDGIALLPIVVAVHETRRRTVERDLPPVRWTFVALSILLLAGFMVFRTQVLGELGGYGRPTAAAAWRNVWTTLHGLYRLVPADREWQPAASFFATWLPLVAVAVWRWITPAARFCLASGAAIALISALPLIFAAKPEQVYLPAFGLSLVLAGAAVGLLDAAARTQWPRAAGLVAGVVLAAALTTFALVSRDITRDFEPFGPIVLSNDQLALTWGVVPAELKDYLMAKREPGARERLSSNPLDVLSIVTFHGHGRDRTSDGIPYVWMDGTWLELYVRGDAHHVTIPVRHEIGAFREPARVRIYADGRAVDDMLLSTSEWRHSSIALLDSDTPRLNRMHRIRITIDTAWRPTEVIPGSMDGRLLGLQVGTPTIR
jgi:hypothetical protein